MKYKQKLVSYGLSVLTATAALIGAAPARCTLFSILLFTLAFAQVRAMAAELAGTVQGASLPIGGATVTLYAAGTGAPTQLAQGKTDDNGAFDLNVDQTPADTVLYLIAKGGTPKGVDLGPIPQGRRVERNRVGFAHCGRQRAQLCKS